MFNVYDLKCEYRTRPVGICESRPRFSWKINSDESGTKQKSYRIVVAKSEVDFSINRFIWDTGKVQSDDCFGIVYSGEPLEIRSVYFWRVEIENNKGDFFVSEINSFETGYFDLNSWNSKWVTAKHSGGFLYGRTEFEINDLEKVKRARLYSATTAGAFGNVTQCMNCVYLSVNGEKIGDDVISPGQISVKKHRAVYRAYDARPNLKNGRNAFGVLFCSMAYSAVLFIEYENGNVTEIFLTDSLITRKNEAYTLWSDGVEEHGGKNETYNPFYEFVGFDTTPFDDAEWQPPVFTDYVKVLREQVVTVKKIRSIQPKSVNCMWECHYIVDFGQVIHGHIKIKFPKTKYRQKVSIVYAEDLYENGELNPMSTINYHHGENGPHVDSYVTTGKENETYEPKFSNHSFRYVDVYNYPGVLNENDISAELICSLADCNSDILCSDNDVNSLFNISRWSQRDNLVSIPTDCPSRERMGWLADAWQCCEAESINFDMLLFMEEWCRTIREEQTENGYVPYICPAPSNFNNVDVAWSSACVFVPWFIYETYGDKKILVDNYEMMAKWICFVDKSADSDGMVKNGCVWGDHTATVGMDGNVIASFYHLLCCETMVKVCKVLDKTFDLYVEMIKKTRSFLHNVYDKADVKSLSQGDLSHCIVLSIGNKKDYLNALTDNLEKNGYRLTCGCLGIYQTINALWKENRNDVIYKILKNEEEGGFLSWIKNHNATTCFEFLHYYNSASKNHPFLTGSLVSWMYRGLAGISPKQSGYRKFEVNPFLGELDDLRANIDTPFGMICFEYSVNEANIWYKLFAPVGTVAEIVIPSDNKRVIVNGKDIEARENRLIVESGTYDIRILR